VSIILHLTQNKTQVLGEGEDNILVPREEKTKRRRGEGEGGVNILESEEGPRCDGGGSGDEKLKDKRQKETKQKGEGFQVKGNGEVAEKKSKCSLSEAAGTSGKTHRGEGVGRGGTVREVEVEEQQEWKK